MTTSNVLLLLSGLIVAKSFVELILNFFNEANCKAHAGTRPSAFKDVVTQEEYEKSTKYTIRKLHFQVAEEVFSALFLLAILLAEALPLAYNAYIGILGDTVWAQSLAVVLTLLTLAIPHLPFELYYQFTIEEEFGFNKMKPSLWVTDKIKGLVLGLAIGTPIVWLVIEFFETAGTLWWVWATGIIFAIQLLMLVLYPRLILPLFNKLSPLPEGNLKERLLKLASKTKFPAATIQIIDGSKRSRHSNAFFTGFGRFRHIVLYDTLLEQLTPTQIEAVLAHEIGHYKCGHIPKRLTLSLFSMGLTFFILHWLIEQEWVYRATGFSQDQGIAPMLLLFAVFGSALSFWITPLMNMWSRKHEYEADSFAKANIESRNSLIEALRKLHQKNLGNLTPHSLYSFFYYSHPTLLERERALQAD